MKKKFCCLLTLILLIFNVFLAKAEPLTEYPESFRISTAEDDIAKVHYNSYTISSKRISAEGYPAYCLNIHKDYPHGQIFYKKEDAEAMINSIIRSGFPTHNPEELEVETEDEAYFATQIAIWAYLENYDVNKITCENKAIEDAIRNIYNNALKNKEELNKAPLKAFPTYEADSKTQKIVVCIDGGFGTVLPYTNKNLGDKIQVKELPKTGGLPSTALVMLSLSTIVIGKILTSKK
jgi:TQXA domain-containing protein